MVWPPEGGVAVTLSTRALKVWPVTAVPPKRTTRKKRRVVDAAKAPLLSVAV